VYSLDPRFLDWWQSCRARLVSELTYSPPACICPEPLNPDVNSIYLQITFSFSPLKQKLCLDNFNWVRVTSNYSKEQQNCSCMKHRITVCVYFQCSHFQDLVQVS
jgi:hypothetical protein